MNASACDQTAPRCLLSVDVEDYFQVEAFADRIGRDEWEHFPRRVVANTHRALDLLSDSGSRATFFVLGWVAERHPEIVKEIHQRGHEVACHSYWHRLVYRLTPDEFREDTRRAKQVLEQITGQPVLGYRAPTYSITRQSLWALDILSEEGFRYDTSIFPIVHDISGIPNYRRTPHRHACSNGKTIVEFPACTVRLGGTNWPVGGGGYLRILPFAYTQWGLRQIASNRGHLVSVYFHPWELDPEQPRLKSRWRSEFRHYTGLAGMEGKLRRLLRSRRFVSFADLLKNGLEIDA